MKTKKTEIHKNPPLKKDNLKPQVSIVIPQLDYLENTKALDTTMAKIKGNHGYYRTLMVLGSLNMFAIGFCMYSVGFLNSLPKFRCPTGPGGAFQSVPEVQACAMLDRCETEWLYDGWVKKYDMICEHRTSRVFYVSLIFLLNAVVFFSLTAMADIIGRNCTLKLSTTLAIAGIFLIYYIDSYPAKIIMFGLVTGTSSVFQMMYTLGLKESVTSDTDLNSYQNMFLNVAYSAAPIVVSGTAILITTSGDLSLISFGLLALFTCGNYFLYYETPLYLYRKRRGKEFINKMFKLAKLNSVTTSKKSLLKQLLDDEVKSRNNQKDNYEHIARQRLKATLASKKRQSQTLIRQKLSKILRLKVAFLNKKHRFSKSKKWRKLLKKGRKFYKQAKDSETNQAEQGAVGRNNLIWITFVLFYWCSSMYLVSYGTITSVDKSGMDNLHVNQALLGLSSMIGYAICIKFPKNVKRIKTISILVLSLLATSALILMLDIYAKDIPEAKIVQSACTVGLMPILVNIGFSVLYMYLPDVYPVTLRGLGIGSVICLGKIFGGVTSSYIANFMVQSGLNPIAGCAIPGCLLLFLVRTIPDG